MGDYNKCNTNEYAEHGLFEKGVILHRHDVLCGRGGQTNNHPGNSWYRRLVRSNRALYRSCPKHSKMLVAKAIVQAIQQQEPPGRFIKLTKGDGNTSEHIWKPITYSQAVNKTSQALREKETASFKRSTNKNSALDIAKETTEIMNYGDEKQRDEGFTNLTDVAIGLATEAQIPSSTLSSSLGRTKTSHGGEQKKTKSAIDCPSITLGEYGFTTNG